jgi:hypothetical protein
LSILYTNQKRKKKLIWASFIQNQKRKKKLIWASFIQNQKRKKQLIWASFIQTKKDWFYVRVVITNPPQIKHIMSSNHLSHYCQPLSLDPVSQTLMAVPNWRKGPLKT